MMNYKQNVLLWLAKFILPSIGLLLAVVYFLAIRPTVKVYRQYAEQCASEKEASPLSVSAGYTTARSNQIQLLYGQFEIDTLSWKSMLWNASSSLSRKYDCRLTSYTAFTRESASGQPLLRQTVGFSGTYFSLLSLLDELEKVKQLGRVSSLRLIRKARQKELQMEVDFSGIQKIKLMKL